MGANPSCNPSFHRRNEQAQTLTHSLHAPNNNKFQGVGVDLLLGRVVGKVNALLDVALESVNGLLQVLVLIAGEVGQGVDSLLSTVWL
jgi:hypothetical protein